MWCEVKRKPKKKNYGNLKNFEIWFWCHIGRTPDRTHPPPSTPLNITLIENNESVPCLLFQYAYNYHRLIFTDNQKPRAHSGCQRQVQLHQYIYEILWYKMPKQISLFPHFMTHYSVQLTSCFTKSHTDTTAHGIEKPISTKKKLIFKSHTRVTHKYRLCTIIIIDESGKHGLNWLTEQQQKQRRRKMNRATEWTKERQQHK